MLPSEFISRYGGITVRTVTIAAGSPEVIPPDPDRFLIAFLGGATGINWGIAPDLDRSTTMPEELFIGESAPRIYDHAHFGPWVCIGWTIRLRTAVPSAAFSYAVGAMKPNQLYMGVSDGEADAKVRILRRNRKQ
jgi:hypothetical protein